MSGQGSYDSSCRASGAWDELAGWFAEMSGEQLQHELVMLTREYSQAGRADRKVIGEQLDVLRAEIASRGDGAAAG